MTEPEQRPESLARPAPEQDISELHGAILRERDDPREGYEPVPLWFIALCGVLVFWAGWYLAEYGGGGQADVLDPRPGARFAGQVGGEKKTDPVALGKKLFTANCVSCHQQSGEGVPGQYPPLAGSPIVLGNPAGPKRILLHGLKGPITVEGATFNGNMPAFGARLSDEYIGAILTYVRQAWGNDAGPVPPESVAATRAATKDRNVEWSASDVEGIETDDWTPPPPPKEEDEGAKKGGK